MGKNKDHRPFLEPKDGLFLSLLKIRLPSFFSSSGPQDRLESCQFNNLFQVLGVVHGLFFRIARLFMALGPLMVCFSCPANAAFLFCNKTAETVETALGYREGAEWISQGWWILPPEQCARVYGGSVQQRFYFYYAHILPEKGQEDESLKIWSGKYVFCVNDKAFRIVGDSNCEERHHRSLGFARVDVGTARKNYTLSFEK